MLLLRYLAKIGRLNLLNKANEFASSRFHCLKNSLWIFERLENHRETVCSKNYPPFAVDDRQLSYYANEYVDMYVERAVQYLGNFNLASNSGPLRIKIHRIESERVRK